ncbi:type VII secretion-associated protein [Corynebacterium sp. H113]|uniref:type VII secretion-associated protein n=1 Tax=Corynebacterium sp. H113 TaxID=3133419 RepID=UPI0030B25863
MEPPRVPHTVLVEVERTRLCVSHIDYEERIISAILTDRASASTPELLTELTIALGAQLCDVPLHLNLRNPAEEFCDISSMEFIVAEGNGSPLVADLRRRGALAYPVPSSEVMAKAGELEQYANAEQAGVIETADNADNADSAESVEITRATVGYETVGEKLSESEPGQNEPRSVERRILAGVGVVAGIMAMVAAVGIIFASPRPDQPDLQASHHEARVDSPLQRQEMPTQSQPLVESHSQPPGHQSSQHPSTNSSQTPEPVNEIMLEGAGVRALFPTGWRIDSTVDGRLIAVSGGPMRVLITAGDVAPSVTLDDVAVGLRDHALTDSTVRAVESTVVKDVDVVTHQEWPADGAVVVWHHRLMKGKQVSVGCQFRDPAIPELRPTCDRVVETVGVL